MKTMVIMNPRSREGPEGEDRVRRRFAEIDATLVETEREGHAEEIARRAVQEGAERVVAVGGDGTVNEVVNGLAPEPGGVQLGVVPAGTGNDFARSLGLPLEIEESLEVLEQGKTATIDLVRARAGEEDHWFANMAAGGFGGNVRETLTSDIKQTWGPFAFFRAAVERLPERSEYEVELWLDSEEAWVGPALNVAVANGRFIAGGIPAAPYAELDDRVVDVIVVRACGLAALTALAPRVLVGRHLEETEEYILFRQAQEVEVRSEPSMPWKLDGEPFVTGNLVFEVEAGALEVIVGPGWTREDE
ncbi:MAG: diacylglycerol kinase family lipid kinase [Thermoanaerobaculia bacterium]|nr:diacylglycerol kinase family lipid kinase [Thermoanaerobaculia bacterium]